MRWCHVAENKVANLRDYGASPLSKSEQAHSSIVPALLLLLHAMQNKAWRAISLPGWRPLHAIAPRPIRRVISVTYSNA